jgi:hypothetical protein
MLEIKIFHGIFFLDQQKIIDCCLQWFLANTYGFLMANTLPDEFGKLVCLDQRDVYVRPKMLKSLRQGDGKLYKK